MATAISSPTTNGGAVVNPLPQQTSLIANMAATYGLEPKAFKDAIKATVFDNKGTNEELCAFLVVADHYDLNPFIKEIYAFQKQGGGIMPIVPVDGWSKIINRNPAFDGMDFIDDRNEAGELLAITCRMYRNDRRHPIECTEYMSECFRPTKPWQQWPRRMLRHKAMIQAARYAFGLSGIMDPDEAERAESVGWSTGESSPSMKQGKVGVSTINAKLLEAKPAQQPDTATHDAEDYVDDSPGDEETQSASLASDAILDAMGACKTKQELDQKYAVYCNALPEGQDAPIEVEASYQEKRDTLPDAGPAKGKQKSLMGD